MPLSWPGAPASPQPPFPGNPCPGADATYPDYDGTTVWTSAQAYASQPSVPFTAPRPTAVAANQSHFTEWLNYDAWLACLGRHSNGSASWSAGWQQTLGLLRAQVAAAQAVAGGNASAKGR